MLISKVTVSFDSKTNPAFTMKAGVLYTNNEIPLWVIKTQNFKDAKAKELISGDYEEKATLNIDLIKRATFLEINFDRNIEETALEALVEDAEQTRSNIISQLEKKGEKVQVTSKTSTLKTKLESLSK